MFFDSIRDGFLYYIYCFTGREKNCPGETPDSGFPILQNLAWGRGLF
jgi:hypothetical protein